MPQPATIGQVALGEIAKQLAQQVLTEPPAPKAGTAAPPENVTAIVLGQVQAMQRACKEDEELVVLFHAGTETVRVLELIVPAWPVLVLSGWDEAKNTTRIVSAAENLQLVCKVMKVQPTHKPVRVSFHVPKPKEK